MLSTRKISILKGRYVSSQFLVRQCSSKNNSKDGEAKVSEQETKNCDASEESAVDRLNRLLASMKTEENFGSMQSVSMARPKERKRKTLDQNNKKESLANENVVEAAKKVASLYGETNKKQVESELLAKLLNLGDRSQKIEQKDENDLSLSELITGMQIDRRQKIKGQTRGDFVRKSLGGKIPPYQRSNPFADDGDTDSVGHGTKTYIGSVNLFGGKPLGIFTNPSQLKESPDMLKTWEHLHKRDLQIQIAHPPRNHFEKMIQWTEQGKLWKFPIDNEQGLDEEAKTDFTEHVFLEQHLEDWCPNRGPVRHYMELVCVGLSKNPYLTAKEKKDHILWYRDYFNQKKDVLKDLLDQEKMALATSSNKMQSSDGALTKES